MESNIFRLTAMNDCVSRQKDYALHIAADCFNFNKLTVAV